MRLLLRLGTPSPIRLVLFLVWLVATASAFAAPAAYSQPKSLRLQFLLENPTANALPRAVFRVYGPAKQTSHQFLEALSASDPYELESDELGNQILVFRFDAFPPYGKKIVVIQAGLLMSSTPQPLPIPRPQLFLGRERFVETDEPEIQAAATLLRRTNDMDTARAVASWVNSHIVDQSFLEEDLGALYALRRHRGDCTEHASLFAALGRALNLPARTVGGFIVTGAGSQALARNYHNWAEYYVEGAWHLADPQLGRVDFGGSDYVALRIISQREANSLGSAHRFATEGGLEARAD